MRPVTVADVTDRYVGWLSDPLIHRFFETRRQTKEQITDYVLQRPPLELWAICRAGTHIGNIRLWRPFPERHPLGEISLFIGERECWGRGFATEAIARICEWGFDHGPPIDPRVPVPSFKKIGASMYAGHTASMRAFAKAGFRLEGIRRKHRMFEGQMTDLYEMGICDDER
mgnify:CR=1 FL=1